MRLKDIMSEPVEAIRPETIVSAAEAKMQQERIHHLVVASGRDVLGVISRRDLAGAPPEAQIGGLMASNVVTASPNMTVRDAANRLRGRGVGCLPVVDRGRLVGIVTIADLLELIGCGVPNTTRWTLPARGPRKARPSADRLRLSYT